MRSLNCQAERTIGVLVVDDHAAVRLGLRVAIGSRPGLACAGAVPDGELVPSLLYRARPDVVVVDYELPRVSGLELCRRIKADVLAPAVAEGERRLPPPVPELAEAAATALHPADRPVLELLLRDTPRAEVAERLDLAVDELDARIRGMLERLARRPT